MEKVFGSSSIALCTRIRLLKCYVWSTMLYGCESWTISQAMERRIMAAEMWLLRRMLKIRWTDKVTNKEVLRRGHTERGLLQTIVTRQISFLGHVMRKDKLEALVLMGKIDSKRGRGRPRLNYMTWMEKATGYKPISLMKMLRDRKENDVMTVANAKIFARQPD